MSYPQAPWTLKGYAIQTVQLVDIEKARLFIPSELEIVSVWPGKTLGTVYISSYGLGSALEYNELIVVAGLVHYGDQTASWISHIYVDHPDSLAGGREIWGLPKEMAEFTWEKEDNRAIVRQGNQLLCSLNYSKPMLTLPMPLAMSCFGSLGNDFVLFKSDFSSRMGLVSGKLEVPPESPFASLNLEQPWLTFYCDDLRLVVGVPEVVGQKSVEFSYS